MPAVKFPHGFAAVYECWVLASNLRHSATRPDWTTEPTIHAIAVWTIQVEEAHRREGHCKRFLDELCADPRFDMVTVQAVQNPHLAEALLRWGWDCDPSIMDFYFRRDQAAQPETR